MHAYFFFFFYTGARVMCMFFPVTKPSISIRPPPKKPRAHTQVHDPLCIFETTVQALFKEFNCVHLPVAVSRIILPNCRPLPLRQVRTPPLPVLRPQTILLQTLLLSSHASAAARNSNTSAATGLQNVRESAPRHRSQRKARLSGH